MARLADSKTLQSFARAQLEDAQKRFASFESEAQKVVEEWVEKGRQRLGGKGLAKDVRKKLDQLQAKVVEAVGVASQAQIRELSRELSRLNKKLDQLTKRAPKPEARA